MSNKIELFKPVKPEEYLEAAKKVAEYIRHYEVVTPEGKHWKIGTVPGRGLDEVESTYLNERNLYSGAAGIGLFLIQLYDITGDKSYLDDAIAAGNYLVATYDKELSKNPSVHAGVSGEGVLLEALYKKTKDETYKEHAVRIADDIYASAVHDESGIHWDGFYDFMGDGGSVIYWLKIAKLSGDDKYIGYAKEVIDSILKLGISYDEEAIYWKLFDPGIYFKELPAGGVVPNFAHGTAGVVYLLTKYYEATKDEAYLEKAKKGFNFLEKIAIYDEDAAIVPYLYFEEGGRPYDVYYLGYCHGPAGDGISVYELYKVTKDEKYLEFFKKLSNALINAGVPFKKSSGYWNDCLCCGSAGVIYHFLTAADIDEKYLAYVKKTADKSIADAYKDEEGYRWYNAWTRVKPWSVDAHLGLYVGAAGSASALLATYARLEGKEITQLFEYDN